MAKKNWVERLLFILEENIVLKSIRNGMIMSIPPIMVGSVALILRTLPIPAYQQFLADFLGGSITTVLTTVQIATLGIVSLIMLLTISYSYGRLKDAVNGGITPFIALCAYIAFTYQSQGFSLEIFQSTWLFNAMVVSLTSSALFLWLHRSIGRMKKTYAEGESWDFNLAISAILPAGIVILLFAVLNTILTELLGDNNIMVHFSSFMSSIFENIGHGLGSGILYMVLLHVLWFFGIHGGNVLDGVAKNVFEAGLGSEIITKTFTDNFILFGGCGTILCLIAAIFIAEKRKNVRSITKMALVPALFNVNELMIFGIPIVLNPIYVIPFILTPTVITIISYLAVVIGIVPAAFHPVEWTTPIFLSGYAATGSVSGSLLQLVNLFVGTAIYLPFVRLAKKRATLAAKRDIQFVTDFLIEKEKTGERPQMLDRTDKIGAISKMLASELQNMIDHHEVQLHYQPQIDEAGNVWGAEALMRWNHPMAGFIYPPLAIIIAQEGGFLNQLEEQIIQRAFHDVQIMLAAGIEVPNISINITPMQLVNPRIIDVIRDNSLRYNVPLARIGFELTEQVALTSNAAMTERLAAIHGLGAQLMIDDFGMGHSSMMYLQDNHFDVVKLDGVLVRDINLNERCRDIIASIVQLSHTLHFEVVAEYVGTLAQREKLKELGCIIYQGFLYSPALPMEEFISYVKGTTNNVEHAEI